RDGLTLACGRVIQRLPGLALLLLAFFPNASGFLFAVQTTLNSKLILIRPVFISGGNYSPALVCTLTQLPRLPYRPVIRTFAYPHGRLGLDLTMGDHFVDHPSFYRPSFCCHAHYFPSCGIFTPSRSC